MINDIIQAKVIPPDQKQLAIDAQDSINIQNQLRDGAIRSAYSSEADPLFFKWQRGEATEQQWLDKIEEIKKRYSETEGDG